MLSSCIDPKFALFLAQQRQQSLLAEVEHDRLVEKVMNSAGDSRPARKGESWLSLQFMAALVLAAGRLGSNVGRDFRVAPPALAPTLPACRSIRDSYAVGSSDTVALPLHL